ncbi:ABC transporter permease [Roseospira visakhapatnamensis]|uniref:Polar amino acid transport system permease protein n=1 Tax=Roseospira visakhapatnamensis TaxID=390880 RepID=A0A7W6RAE1_9PROT|nr:polar amino acid transport system permease protein [Roseospira visakhapatnamensis]
MPDLHGFEDELLLGLWMTVRLALTALAIGLVLGLAGAAAMASSIAPARWIATAYTTIIRGIPELLVVLLIYFGASTVLMAVARPFGHTGYLELSPFIAGSLALGLTFGGYAAEVFRGAFQSVSPGQREAAQALGMGPVDIFFRIVLPQAWRLALPGLGNLFLVLMKDTALVSVIGLEEVMRKAQFAVGATKEPFTFYLAAAVIYLGLTVISMGILAVLERRANRGLPGMRVT